MPYNFRDMKPYSIDYGDLERLLFSGFLSCRLSEQDEMRLHNYIEKWLHDLRYYDGKVMEGMAAPNAELQYILSWHNSEILHFPLHLGANEIFLSFLATPIRQALLKQGAKPETLTIHQLIEVEKTKWTEETSPSRRPATEPIIVVLLPVGDKNLLVIDGNHRLSAAIRQKSETISIYRVSPDTLINQPLFSSGFEQQFYKMLIDIYKISQGLSNGSPLEILISSL